LCLVTRSSEDPRDQAAQLRQFQQELDSMGPGDLEALLQQLLAAGRAALDAELTDEPDPFERPTPPSRRRERRADVVTYRVRVDLTGTKPPLWRRLELASDMFLDELHDVLQVAFGWTDSHLHRFGAGKEYYRRDTEYYLSPFEVEEGEVGVPEDEVRLDEVLVDVGDKLFYAYDFGDDWQHTVRLEAVLPRDEGAPRAVCTAGKRPGPPEDCGGVPGYELSIAATDPTHEHHAAARAEFAEMYGPEVEPYDPIPFDIDAINEQLADLGPGPELPADLPEPIADLLSSIVTARQLKAMRSLIGKALNEPVEIDTETAARMVHPYTWLLDRVGDEGITLTAAGYLPPSHVEAAATELGLADEWVGKLNRENQTVPVLHLRESAQKMGLLRKNRGKLLVTTRGRKLRTDPIGLWWHLAERLPLKSNDHCANQAGLLLLAGVAAEAKDVFATIARTLSAIGWTLADGTPLDDGDAVRAAWDTWDVLRRLGAFTGRRYRRDERSTPEGVAFARAALQTWPTGS
jgi:Plasmid pRiA4b ORF-3-like protein